MNSARAEAANQHNDDTVRQLPPWDDPEANSMHESDLEPETSDPYPNQESDREIEKARKLLLTIEQEAIKLAQKEFS